GLGPGGDVNQGRGLAEAGGQQQGEDAAVRELPLRGGGQMGINDIGEPQALGQRGGEGQGPGGGGLFRDGGVLPGEGHKTSSEGHVGGGEPRGSDFGGATPSYKRRQVA